MEKINYKLKKLNNSHFTAIEKLLNKNEDISPIMAKLYALRGVKEFDDINFLQKLEPFTNLKGIDKATEMLSKAIIAKDRICIVADYDVDGATSCAIGLRGLKMFGANVDYIVPNRFIHGYGLTPTVVLEAIEKKNPDLIVTVDNGISAFDGVKCAHENGIKVLVTDHHLAGETLPDADCIVNPNQPDCQFKSKSMAGCGVMFYVLFALRQKMINLGLYTEKTAPQIHSLLDLVAIGTIADVVKLDKNNRIMVKHGLDRIRKEKSRPGVYALAQVAKRKHEELTTIDIGFGLGPRINAAGRLEDMSIGIQALMTENFETAFKLACELDEINKTRKEIEGDMKLEAMELPSLQDSKFSKVAFAESFHEGVIGIVASRIKELFYRPTIVFAPAQEEGFIKGSGRSIPEIHLRDALDYVSKKRPDILYKFGGHAMAAGLTIEKKYLKEFSDLFEEAVEYYADGKELKNIKEVDLELHASDISIDLAEEIKDEIWGQGFLPPLFIGEFEIIEQKILKDAHLKLKVMKDGLEFDGIWFFNNEELLGNKIKLIYTLGINDFNQRRTVQLMVEGAIDI